MVPYFQMAKAQNHRLMVRGKLEVDDFALFRRGLSPNGLCPKNIMKRPQDIWGLQGFFQPWR
jgi:hypothetical protein